MYGKTPLMLATTGGVTAAASGLVGVWYLVGAVAAIVGALAIRALALRPGRVTSR